MRFLRRCGREHGITLVGPPARELIPPVSRAELDAEMHHNLHVYWRRRAEQLHRLLFDRAVRFALETIPRILHTRETGAIISKGAALAAFLERRPEWCDLAEPTGITRRWARALRTQEFLRAMIDQCAATRKS